MTTSYLAQIESRVAGIPCIIGVIEYTSVASDSRADSDWDYAGYTECNFAVCDSRGRPAPWLDRKLTAKEISRIESEIASHFGE